MIRVVDEWWGAKISSALPRYLLDHFSNTSIVAEHKGTPVAFLVGFLSAADADGAYIHFVGVRPDARRHGIAANLYRQFFEMARREGRTKVKSITSPGNTGSIEFHRKMGFSVSEPVENYNGAGVTRIVFSRSL